MNSRDKRGLLVGNAAFDDAGAAFYGGTDLWTHLDYVKYLIANFIQQDDGPTWTVGGQADILDSMITTVKFPDAVSVADMLRELIPVRYGVDFFIRPTEAGFEITVFALGSSDQSYSGVTMPKNPSTVKLIKSQIVEGATYENKNLIECHVVESLDKKYDAIAVLGKRIVVCGSLFGLNFPGNNAAGTSLVAKWSAALEADYITPAGATTDQYDQVRKLEKYRDVYQHLGAPVGWNLNSGDWARSCSIDGSITTTDQYQTVVRETLAWIPLWEGFDYSVYPPADNTLGTTVQSDVKPPIAWIKDPAPDDGSPPGYRACHNMGENSVHVHHAYQDWGIVLDASPNHLLGLNHFSSADAGWECKFDYTTAVCTIAIESDHRVGLGYRIPDAMASGDGSVMTILDEQAELWYMLEGTIVDVDKDGNPVKADGRNKLLRDDRSRLALTMAGAITKYIDERFRAAFTLKNFYPWGQLLGQILSVIQQGDDVQQIGAPITSVEWMLEPSPMTIVKTGYA
jgi:hypothetical protein